MAYVKTWSTKEDVLKDLARASGRRMKKKEHLDEGYLVSGDGPPPVIVEDEDDDEMQLLFGEAVSRKPVQTEDATPDLLGIQQMLRMVKDFNKEDDDDIETNDPANSSDCVITITKVSKLNPNVREFTPKSDTPSIKTNNKHISDSINVSIVTQTDDVQTEDSINKKDTDGESNNENLTVDLDVDVNNVKPNEYQDIATKLKNKISVASKSDSFEFKKQKNVAIATLLRLYATNNKSPTQSTEHIKLITPEFFEGKKEDDLDVQVEGVTKAPLTVSSVTSTSSTPEPKNSSTTIPTCSSNSINSTPRQTSSENNFKETNSKKRKPANKVDPEIKRSIEKVNKWLEEPTKTKTPAVCLGPIAFKRKDPSSCKSPVSDPEQKASKPFSEGQRYQPSNYAADLGRKYMERNKIKEDKKKDVTWLNLDEILKQKDLVIKKRLEEQASASDSNDDSVTPQR